MGGGGGAKKKKKEKNRRPKRDQNRKFCKSTRKYRQFENVLLSVGRGKISLFPSPPQRFSFFFIRFFTWFFSAAKRFRKIRRKSGNCLSNLICWLRFPLPTVSLHFENVIKNRYRKIYISIMTFFFLFEALYLSFEIFIIL